jgi:Arc/MetJ family transcription regulator
MARTNIDLDEKLTKEGMLIFQCKTKKELIHLALKELLKAEKRKEILKLRGRLSWEGDTDTFRDPLSEGTGEEKG